MEPCSSDEFFQALNHAEQTFKKMENYLRHKQLCDVILVAGDRRIPAHRWLFSTFPLFSYMKCSLGNVTRYLCGEVSEVHQVTLRPQGGDLPLRMSMKKTACAIAKYKCLCFLLWKHRRQPQVSQHCLL
jgi:hypothetical protein